MPGRSDERKELAEQWRRLGEKLRSRSPMAFAKLVAMLAGSAGDDDDDDGKMIDNVYTIH